ncbi:MAG: hypothetical protein JSV19_13695 [Phycisphaerales bacterium]|nr:MAG: hypothetical protein JSV19_13695 [Phycisphaerales bacterium]
MDQLLAQANQFSDADTAAAATAIGMGILLLSCFGLVIGLGIQAAICWFVSNCFQSVPQEYRQQSPGMVWLLMIPLFNVVWNFFVYPKLAQSFKAYFDANGVQDVGDCGGQLAMGFCICVAGAVVLGFLPVLGFLSPLAALASVVLLILVLVKANDLKKRIPAGAGAPPAASAR